MTEAVISMRVQLYYFVNLVMVDVLGFSGTDLITVVAVVIFSCSAE